MSQAYHQYWQLSTLIYRHW